MTTDIQIYYKKVLTHEKIGVCLIFYFPDNTHPLPHVSKKELR